MAKWYIVSPDGLEKGPFEDKDLMAMARSGALRPTATIRRSDRTAGTPASAVRGLFADTAATPRPVESKADSSQRPPPLPAPPTTPRTDGSPQSSLPSQQPRPLKTWAWSDPRAHLLCLVVALLVYYRYADHSRRVALRAESAIAAGNNQPAAAEEHNAIPGQVGQPNPAPPAKAAAGSKLKAFRALVARIKQSPGRLATTGEARRYVAEINILNNAFERIPFDPLANRKEAEAIILLYEKELEGRFSGEAMRVIGGYIELMISTIISSE